MADGHGFAHCCRKYAPVDTMLPFVQPKTIRIINPLTVSETWNAPACYWLSTRRLLSCGTDQMSEHLGQMPIHHLMLNNARTRATHYRQQAAELRGMAENQSNAKVRRDLLDLATSYDALANRVLPNHRRLGRLMC